MLNSFRALPILVLALATAACSSTTASGPISPVRAASDGSRTKARATIRIVIPHHRLHRRVLRHGHYISAATKSVAIAVTATGGGAAQNFNADLTPATNPNCVTISSSLVCTLTFSLAAANYTVNVATYDGLLAGGNAPNNPPTGNELSTNQSVPLAVTLGGKNNVNVTLEGIPASVALVPAGSSTLSGDDVSGFALARCTPPPQNVNVYGVDADNNYILGPGAPTVSLTSNDTTNLPVTATPAASAPNQFTLTPPAYPTKSAVVQLTAGATPGTGSGASLKSAKINVTFASTTCYSLTEYAGPGLSGGAPGNPQGIASNNASKLWFTDANNVAAITTAGAAAGLTSLGVSAVPDSLAFDGTNMWATNFGGTNVMKVSPAGTVIGTYTVGSGPDAIAYDGTNMWVANYYGTSVTKLSPTGTNLGTFSVGSVPDAIAFDGTNMWVANYGGTSVTKLSPSGVTLGTYTVGSTPDGIAFDGTNMWVTNYADNTITELSPTGSTIATYTVPTSSSGPDGIAFGADSAMWFTEINGNKIGRVTSAGGFTEFTVPTSASKPTGITKGPDSAIWFTEQSGDKIGQIQTH